MGNKSSSMLQDDEIHLISSETGFTPSQIEKLYARFTSLDKEAVGSLCREDFLRVPELAINPLCNRIVEMFFTDLAVVQPDHSPGAEGNGSGAGGGGGGSNSRGGGGDDGENNDRINFRQFMRVLATFRSSHHHHSSSSNLQQKPSKAAGQAEQQHKASLSRSASANSQTANNNSYSHYDNNNYNNNNNLHNNHQHHNHRVEFTQANSVAILSQSHHGDHHLGPHGSGLHPGGMNRNASSPHGMYKNGGLLDVYDDHNKYKNRKVSSPIYSMHDANYSHHWTPIYDDNEPKNSRKHKLYFMFRLYDVDNDNRISFDDLKCILKQMVGNYIDEAQTNKIVARAFHEVDKDGDNHINFDEFCQVFEGNDIDEKLRIKISH